MLRVGKAPALSIGRSSLVIIGRWSAWGGWIFLAFIASDGLLSVLGDNYPGIQNGNMLHKEVVSYNGGSAKDFDICCFLVGSPTFGFLDPQSCYDGAFFKIML